MGSFKIGTIRQHQPKGEPVREREETHTVSEETTYTPSDAPEPAKPIKGDQPLPDLDTDNKDEPEEEE